MTKIFVSQPMKDRSDEEILAERKDVVNFVESVIPDEIEVLDTFFTDNVERTPLQNLAKSLGMLSEVDVAVFVRGWEHARGCSIEHKCCVEYGIDIIYA